MQALGQLALLLMKHVDFDREVSSAGELWSDFVKKCSFELKTWKEVSEHAAVKGQIFEESKESLA